jgi:hypothetical protein
MQSVADLVEGVAQGKDVDPGLFGDSVALVERGTVKLTEFGPLTVAAEVNGKTVTLKAHGDRLEVSTGGWTPESLAVAITAWQKAPKRRR